MVLVVDPHVAPIQRSGGIGPRRVPSDHKSYNIAQLSASLMQLIDKKVALTASPL